MIQAALTVYLRGGTRSIWTSDLQAGLPARIGTATGSFYGFGLELTLCAFELEWKAVVYFAEPEEFDINVVGRVGFLDRLKVGIVDYEQLLYLGLYDEA